MINVQFLAPEFKPLHKSAKGAVALVYFAPGAEGHCA